MSCGLFVLFARLSGICFGTWPGQAEDPVSE